MNVQKAIRILKQRAHFIRIEECGKDWKLIWDSGYSSIYTNRELINFARCYTSEYTEPVSKILKTFNPKVRRKTRQMVHEEKFDDIPTDKPVYKEDGWHYD